MKIKSSGGWAGGFEQGLVQVKTVKVMEAKEKVFFFSLNLFSPYFARRSLTCDSFNPENTSAMQSTS